MLVFGTKDQDVNSNLFPISVLDASYSLANVGLSGK
jgi:hypothetical protein